MNGRFPTTLAPAAVKNAPNPVQKVKSPIVQVLTVSVLMANCWAMMGMAGVSMAAMLKFCKHIFK